MLQRVAINRHRHAMVTTELYSDVHRHRRCPGQGYLSLETRFNGGLMCRVRHRNCGVLSGVRQYVSYYASSINLMRNNIESNEKACSSHFGVSPRDGKMSSQENLMISRTAAFGRIRAQQMQECNINAKF